jgi:hypothetical protein
MTEDLNLSDIAIDDELDLGEDLPEEEIDALIL